MERSKHAVRRITAYVEAGFTVDAYLTDQLTTLLETELRLCEMLDLIRRTRTYLTDEGNDEIGRVLVKSQLLAVTNRILAIYAYSSAEVNH